PGHRHCGLPSSCRWRGGGFGPPELLTGQHRAKVGIPLLCREVAIEVEVARCNHWLRYRLGDRHQGPGVVCPESSVAAGQMDLDDVELLISGPPRNRQIKGLRWFQSTIRTVLDRPS